MSPQVPRTPDHAPRTPEAAAENRTAAPAAGDWTQERIARLTAERDAARQALAEADDLRAEDLHQLTRSLSEAEERAIARTEELRQARASVRDLQKRLDQTRTDLDEARDRGRTLETRCTGLDLALDRARADLVIHSDAAALSDQTIAGLREALQARTTELGTRTAERDSARAEAARQAEQSEISLAELRQTLERRTAEVEEARALARGREGEAAAARRRLRAAERRIASLEARLEKTGQTLAEVLADRDALHRAREAMEASTSWRATAPLRRARSLLGRDGD